MKTKEVLAGLEQECKQMGVKLIYDELQSEGGWCRVKGEYKIIINRRTSPESRARIIREALLEIRRRIQESTVCGVQAAASVEAAVPVADVTKTASGA